MDHKKYFEKYGDTVFGDPGWGWEPLTVNLMFEMFKARMIEETKAEGFATAMNLGFQTAREEPHE